MSDYKDPTELEPTPSETVPVIDPPIEWAAADKLTFTTTDNICATISHPSSLTFHLLGKGEFTISLKDGSIEFQNCTIPEAAQEFWRAVTEAFPGVAQGILEHAKAQETEDEDYKRETLKDWINRQ